MEKSIAELREEVNRLQSIVVDYERWYYLYRNQRKINDYLQINGFQKIAIYGIGAIGRQLVEELLQEGVNIKYLIDLNADKIHMNIDTPIVHPNEKLQDVDVIIVTVVGDAGKKIKKNYEDKFQIPAIQFSDLLAQL